MRTTFAMRGWSRPFDEAFWLLHEHPHSRQAKQRTRNGEGTFRCGGSRRMNFQLRARFSGAKCSFRATMGQGATTAGIGLSTAVLDRFTLGMDLPQRADQGWYGGTLQPDLTFAIVGVPDGHVQPVFRFHNFIDAVESSVRAALYCRNPGKNWHRSSQCRRRPHRTCAEKAAPFSQTQDTTGAAVSRQSAAVLSQT